MFASSLNQKSQMELLAHPFHTNCQHPSPRTQCPSISNKPPRQLVPYQSTAELRKDTDSRVSDATPNIRPISVPLKLVLSK